MLPLLLPDTWSSAPGPLEVTDRWTKWVWVKGEVDRGRAIGGRGWGEGSGMKEWTERGVDSRVWIGGRGRGKWNEAESTEGEEPDMVEGSQRGKKERQRQDKKWRRRRNQQRGRRGEGEGKGGHTDRELKLGAVGDTLAPLPLTPGDPAHPTAWPHCIQQPACPRSDDRSPEP